MNRKVFPIQTDTACQMKWNWSTLYLNTGLTRSCHRTAESELTPENFNNFHNTPIKLADRARMLQGLWPETSCTYCQEIERAGGTSDRLRLLTIPDLAPIELDTDPTATCVSPTIVEVFFNNACNLGCLYCSPELSSVIDAENVKYGTFDHQGVVLAPSKNRYKEMAPYFWNWFPEGFTKIKRFHVLGGEPFFQKEFDKLLEMIKQYPNPNCELNIITNLMVPKARIEFYINQFKELLLKKHIKRIDITCSIDCWGPQQEYVRWGLNLAHWEDNFQLLLDNRWIYLNINQTISPLTIKTMPELLKKLQQWRKVRKVNHWFGCVTPGEPSYLKTDIFGNREFANDRDAILNLMPVDTDEDVAAYNYMSGIFSQMLNSLPDYDEIKKLIIFLNEKDRRRNTDWEVLFPWLTEYKKYVV